MRVFSVTGRLDWSGQKSLRGRYLTNASAAHISRHSEHTDAAPRSLASDHAESTPLPLHPISAVSTSLLHRRSPCTNTHTHTHIICSNRYYKLRGSLQAGSDSSPVSKQPRTTVSVGALHPGLQCWHAAACAFCQPSPTCHTAFPAHQKALSAAGAIAWNSLPDFTWDPTSSTDCFRWLLKTNLFAQY